MQKIIFLKKPDIYKCNSKKCLKINLQITAIQNIWADPKNKNGENKTRK